MARLSEKQKLQDWRESLSQPAVAGTSSGLNESQRARLNELRVQFAHENGNPTNEINPLTGKAYGDVERYTVDNIVNQEDINRMNVAESGATNFTNPITGERYFDAGHHVKGEERFDRAMQSVNDMKLSQLKFLARDESLYGKLGGLLFEAPEGERLSSYEGGIQVGPERLNNQKTDEFKLFATLGQMDHEQGNVYMGSMMEAHDLYKLADAYNEAGLTMQGMDSTAMRLALDSKMDRDNSTYRLPIASSEDFRVIDDRFGGVVEEKSSDYLPKRLFNVDPINKPLIEKEADRFSDLSRPRVKSTEDIVHTIIDLYDKRHM